MNRQISAQKSSESRTGQSAKLSGGCAGSLWTRREPGTGVEFARAKFPLPSEKTCATYAGASPFVQVQDIGQSNGKAWSPSIAAQGALPTGGLWTSNWVPSFAWQQQGQSFADASCNDNTTPHPFGDNSSATQSRQGACSRGCTSSITAASRVHASLNKWAKKCMESPYGIQRTGRFIGESLRAS